MSEFLEFHTLSHIRHKPLHRIYCELGKKYVSVNTIWIEAGMGF